MTLPADALAAAVLCLGLNLYHEGLKSEPVIGLFAIAQATLNRADRKPEKVCEVVQARKQFSWTLKPPPVVEGRAWQTAKEIAQLSFYTADFTGGATHFHAILCPPDRLNECKPYWRTDMIVLGHWGSHIFYRARKP